MWRNAYYVVLDEWPRTAEKGRSPGPSDRSRRSPGLLQIEDPPLRPPVLLPLPSSDDAALRIAPGGVVAFRVRSAHCCAAQTPPRPLRITARRPDREVLSFTASCGSTFPPRFAIGSFHPRLLSPLEPAFRSAKTMFLFAFAQVKGYFLSHRVMPRLSSVVPRIAGLRTGHTPFIHRSSTRLPTDRRRSETAQTPETARSRPTQAGRRRVKPGTGSCSSCGAVR